MGLEQLSLVKQATANMDGITTITEINGQLLHGTLPDNPARIHQSRPRRAEHHSARAPLQLRDDGIDHHLGATRSEEHTSELQSRPHLVCRLLLEKKKKLN